MKCPRCNSWGRRGETSKWQWVNSKLVSFWSGFRIHKLNFEIISKWLFSLVQLFSNGHNFFISAPICTPLKRWTPEFPSFETIYSMYTMDSSKCFKFVLKIIVYNAIRFLSSKFPCSWILLHASFSTLFCLLCYSIMAISPLPNSWYPRLAFSYVQWVLTHLFLHLVLSRSFKI